MPAIRQYGQRVNAPDAGVGLARNAPAEAFGVGEGAAQGALGQAVSSVGDRLMKIQEQNEVLEVGKNLAKARAKLSAQFKEEYNKADLSDKDFAKKFLDKAKGELDSIKGNIGTRAGAMAFEEQRSSLYQSLSSTAESAQVQLAGMKASSDFSETINSLSSSVVSSPTDLNSVLEQYEKESEAMVSTGLISREAMAQDKENHRGLIAQSAVQGWIDLDAGLAYNKLKNGEFDKLIDGKTKASLMRSAKSNLDNARKMSQGREETLRAMRRNNQYKFARAEEIQFNYEPVDFTDKNSFKNREDWRDSFKAKYGTKPPLLDEDEEFAVIESLNKGDAKQVSQTLGFFRENMMKEQFNDFNAQMFKKNPEIGVALGVSRDNMDAARDIVLGSRIKKAENFKLSSSPNSIKDAFNGYMGDALGNERGEVELKENTYMAVESLLALQKSNGEISGDPSKSDVEKAFQRVMGPTFEVNGKKTLTFKGRDGQWVDDNYFENIIEDSSIDLIKQTQGGKLPLIGGDTKTPISKKALEDNVRYIPRADGKYYLNYNGDFLTNEDGSPYLMDLKAIEATGKIKKPNFFGF